MSFDIPLKVGFCGETKIGKSHLGARFAKELDGVFLDFAAIQQISDRKNAPTYDVSKLSRGEAFRAVKTVGLDAEQQYRFIKNWDDLENAIEYARIYRDDISKKENGRLWLVFDDTAMWRWHEALHALKVSGHKSMTKDDWGMATTSMTLRIRTLEPEFNLLFINQMQDLYESGENTGRRVGKFYPNGIDFALDVVGELWVDREKKPYRQHMKVLANRSNWLCLDDFTEDVVNPAPKTLLESLKVEQELW